MRTLKIINKQSIGMLPLTSGILGKKLKKSILQSYRSYCQNISGKTQNIFGNSLTSRTKCNQFCLPACLVKYNESRFDDCQVILYAFVQFFKATYALVNTSACYEMPNLANPCNHGILFLNTFTEDTELFKKSLNLRKL